MGKENGNGPRFERRYTDDEIAAMHKRVTDIRDLVDRKKEEIKALNEEEKEIRIDRRRGYELVEGEELPFEKRPS